MKDSWGPFVEVEKKCPGQSSNVFVFVFFGSIENSFFARVHTVQDEQGWCIVVRRVLF